MATTIPDSGFVEVGGTLEPAAIAAEIASDAHRRVAEAMTLTVDHLDYDDHGLNQLQKVELTENFLRCLDGFERSTLDELMRRFEEANRQGSGDGR